MTLEFEVNHESYERNQKALLCPHSWSKNVCVFAEMLEKKNKRNMKEGNDSQILLSETGMPTVQDSTSHLIAVVLVHLVGLSKQYYVSVLDDINTTSRNSLPGLQTQGTLISLSMCADE